VNIFKTVIYSCDQSLIFSIITPVSHDPSEITLICGYDAQKHSLLLLMLKRVLDNFFRDSLMN